MIDHNNPSPTSFARNNPGKFLEYHKKRPSYTNFINKYFERVLNIKIISRKATKGQYVPLILACINCFKLDVLFVTATFSP